MHILCNIPKVCLVLFVGVLDIEVYNLHQCFINWVLFDGLLFISNYLVFKAVRLLDGHP